MTLVRGTTGPPALAVISVSAYAVTCPGSLVGGTRDEGSVSSGPSLPLLLSKNNGMSDLNHFHIMYFKDLPGSGVPKGNRGMKDWLPGTNSPSLPCDWRACV